MTPAGMPSSSMVSEMIPVGSPSAMRRSTTPCGGRGTAISLMFSAAMRPVNRFFSATFTGALPVGRPRRAAHFTSILTHKKAQCRGEGGQNRLSRAACHRCQRALLPTRTERVGIAPCDLRDERSSTQCPPCNVQQHGPRGSALTLGACPEERGSLPLPPPGTARGQAPMIDLYALTSPNVQKIYIMLEECGLPYKEHFVDVWKGDQYKPDFAKINPEQQNSRDRRSRRTGRQALRGDRVGRDPALSRREDRKVSAQGRRQEIRGDPVADDPAHRRRTDVRTMDPLQAVRAQERQ